ncbi:uncharacterized protein LOC118363327 isoform X3 [Oncorhynchus keta]|uniref:uncharacterized protein LOC118363327 isoform X3 n=1 Tax=Oncorhynchus keta TaxID=8018 RepID=UPI00227D41F6|nr:uncharacterized protein LOC118363327 isoform X3 [Oncorhynchus keta]
MYVMWMISGYEISHFFISLCSRGSYGAGNDWPFSQPAHLVLPKVCHQFPGSSASSPCCRFWTCALTVSVWLLTGCAWYCERLGELGPAASTEASHRACQERLRDLVNRTKNRALVHIACLENQASWTNVEQAFLKVTEGLNSLTNQTLRGKLEVCISLYSYDSVGTVRPPASLIVPLGPCLHHAGRNHEPDGGDSATDGTADDDQEGADSGCRPLPCLQRACWLCRDTCCLEKAWTPSWLHIAATGKLTSFARMFIKLNEFLKHFSGEGFVLGASPAVRHILLHAVSRVADLRIRSDPVGPQPLGGEQDPEPRPPPL